MRIHVHKLKPISGSHFHVPPYNCFSRIVAIKTKAHEIHKRFFTFPFTGTSKNWVNISEGKGHPKNRTDKMLDVKCLANIFVTLLRNSK